MQLNDGEMELYEHLCGEYMADRAVPDLVYETSLPIAGKAAEMLTFLEDANDEEWARFIQELMFAASKHESDRFAPILDLFMLAAPPFSRVWELLSLYAPDAAKELEDGGVCFGLTPSKEPVYCLSHGYVQRAGDGSEDVFLFEENGTSWATHRIPNTSVLLFVELLPVLLRHAARGSEDPMALAALREFFMSAWKKRRDDAKARFEDAQYVVPCEDHGAHLFRQLPVFSFGEGKLRRNYRVRRVHPSPDMPAHSKRFNAGVEDFQKRLSSILLSAREIEDMLFAAPDVSLMCRPFLEVAEEIIRDKELDQVLVTVADTLHLLTHERFIEES